MNRCLLMLAALMAVSACGIKRPLIAPRDIPEYERKRLERLEKQKIEVEPAPATTPEV
jgi:hypothetical protein